MVLLSAKASERLSASMKLRGSEVAFNYVPIEEGRNYESI